MIKLNSLTCGHKEAALFNVDFELNVSEVTTLLGPNGSGKSCLLETIVGKLSPLAGSISGVPKKTKELAHLISYAEQTPIEGHDLKVNEYFALIEPKISSINLVEYFGLADFLGRPLYALSGGQRQLIRLCACLMQDSKYYFLDEPTNSLDPRPIELLTNLIRKMRARGKSFLIVTHELPFALSLGERFIGFKDQKMAFDCDLDVLEDNALLDQMFERRFQWVKLQDGRRVVC